jgi:hypothetical protein
MKQRLKTRRALAILTCLALPLCVAASAQAKNDPLGSGTTKLTLDKSLLSFLARNDLKLKAKLGAKRQGKTIRLAITGGTMDLAKGTGEILQEGTLLFEGKKGKVPLRNLTLKTKRTPLIAKVGGSQLKVASAQAISSKRAGFGSAFTATRLTLTAKVATRLNKKLRPEVPFTEGQAIGSLTAKPQPELVTIKDEGRATLSLDPSFAAKLDSRFVSLNPISPAERQGLVFIFPIAAGGSLAPNGSQGTLRGAGAIELLQLHGAQLFWSEPWLDLGTHSQSAEVDLEPTPAFPGKVGRLGVFDLGPTSITSEPKARTISVLGAPLTLNATAAQQLNQAFGGGSAPFAAGEPLGAVSFVAVAE